MMWIMIPGIVSIIAIAYLIGTLHGSNKVLNEWRKVLEEHMQLQHTIGEREKELWSSMQAKWTNKKEE